MLWFLLTWPDTQNIEQIYLNDDITNPKILIRDEHTYTDWQQKKTHKIITGGIIWYQFLAMTTHTSLNDKINTTILDQHMHQYSINI